MLPHLTNTRCVHASRIPPNIAGIQSATRAVYESLRGMVTNESGQVYDIHGEGDNWEHLPS